LAQGARAAGAAHRERDGVDARRVVAHARIAVAARPGRAEVPAPVGDVADRAGGELHLYARRTAGAILGERGVRATPAGRVDRAVVLRLTREQADPEQERERAREQPAHPASERAREREANTLVGHRRAPGDPD